MSRTTISDRDTDDGDTAEEADGGHGRGLRRALSGVGLLVSAGAGALLAVGGFLGLYLRPTSDDWCALWKARDMGVLGITEDFYLTQNGRVTNAFLTGLLYSDDMRGPKLLPAVLVAALVGGLLLLGRAAVRATALRPAPPTVLLLASAALLSALLFFAGTRSYQVLLWAPATISHTLPSVIGLWAVLGAVRAGRRGGPRWARSAAVASALLTGVALGMLSEPYAVVAGLFAATVGILCLPRLGWARDRYVSTWCAAACLGLLSGLVLLSTSPGARWRRAQHPSEPLSLAEVGATLHDWWRLWQTVGGQWAYAGALAVGVLLGLALASSPAGERSLSLPSPRLLRALALLPLPLVALASLAVVHGLRSGYGDVGWTYARVWTSFLLPLLLALCAYGAWGGHWLGRRVLLASAPGGGRPAARVATLLAVGALAVGSATALVRPVYELTTTTVMRSAAWDRQNARIREEVAAGARDVVYRPYLIGKLTEPLFAASYERDWAARCAATYYGVDRIHLP
ncbi:DUF6056 family protein [Streptomyces sp. NPDC020807]|uniref:DUF6056 family protein n=1 Tax=Streptomyces sp. NPDC020807 TaxID=3155119 RepID=UPI0033CC7808